MIFAVSRVSFCSIYRETSPPPPTSSLLFAAVDSGDSDSGGGDEAVEEVIESLRFPSWPCGARETIKASDSA